MAYWYARNMVENWVSCIRTQGGTQLTAQLVPIHADRGRYLSRFSWLLSLLRDVLHPTSTGASPLCSAASNMVVQFEENKLFFKNK